jgi:hypothetical protein
VASRHPGDLRPTTHDHDARMAASYVVPAVGAVRLQSLTPARLNALYAALYADLMANGRRWRPGEGLAPKTVRHVHTMLHKALADAVRWGRVPSNVATSPTHPARRHPRCTSGHPSNCGPSPRPSATTGCSPRGC